jgi:4-carboxymuconolactone decarboxylase
MIQSILDPSRWALVELSAALASRDPRALEEAMEEASRSGRDAQVEEAILQSYLFLGYPLALNAFALWRDGWRRNPDQGTPDDWDRWTERGEEVCRVVYGGQYERLRRNVRYLHPDMERWMVVEGYGKVLGRPGLDLATRELCIVALLAVLGVPRQLYSHLRGALSAGARPREIEEALEVASRHMGKEEVGRAHRVWSRVRDRPSGSGEPDQG